jgi:glutathione synthase/RimK-type ligase-like ATP-grasp enzyme
MNRDARSYLAYIKSTRPTGKAIASQLDVTACGIKVPDPSVPLDVLIRWGSRKDMPPAAIVLNDAKAIKVASDKIQTLTQLNSHAIKTVRWFRTWDEAVRKVPRGVILGRDLTGFAGRDIVAYDSTGAVDRTLPREPVKQHDWYSVYAHPSREVRIHVVRGKVIRVQGKYCDFPVQARTNPYVRNYAQGYRYRAPNQELHRQRKTAATDAISALGLDFGAVDMLLLGESRDCLILEVNTAPACSPLTARCYSAELALIVEQESGGEIRLAPGVMDTEVHDMPEESDIEERYR